MSAGGIAKNALAALLPGKVLTRNRDRGVVLTFDDGPHPSHTHKVLDILAQYQVRAAFFLQGHEAEKHPELVRAIHAAGHQIGNHGYAHHDARRTAWRVYVNDVHRAQKILQDIVGHPLERLFRPPFGSMAVTAFVPLAAAGYRFVFWSVDSRDSFIRDPQALLAYMRAMPLRHGDIVLFHEDYAHTVDSLPDILREWQSRSFSFARIT